MLSNRILVAAIAAVVMSCDTFYGISRQGYMAVRPPLPCIERVIRADPSVRTLQYREIRENRGLFRKLEIVSSIYSYAGEDYQSEFWIEKRANGETFVRHSSGGLHALYPQERADRVRPIMSRIERKIHTTCDIDFQDAELHEYCSGINCDKDAA